MRDILWGVVIAVAVLLIFSIVIFDTTQSRKYNSYELCVNTERDNCEAILGVFDEG